MKTTLRTELPEGYRDHGVFVEDTPESPTPTAEDFKAQVARVTATKARADARLAALFAKVQAGTIGAEEFASLPELAAKSIHLAKDLEAAQAAEAEAEQRRLRSADAELRAKLEALLMSAAQHKKEFAAAFKAACVTLGSFCADIDEANQVLASRSQLLNLPLLESSRTRNANHIATLSADLDPRPTLKAAGLYGTVRFGWDFRFEITPLYETRKEL